MDPIARSPGLNPASTPFFPGGMRVNEENGRGSGLGFRMPTNRDQQFSTSTFSLSLSPTDHRSVRSSPSPQAQDDRDRGPETRMQFNPSREDLQRRSPAGAPPDMDKTFSNERPLSRSLSEVTEPDDTPGPSYNGQLASNTTSALGTIFGRSRELLNTQSAMLESGTANARSSLIHASFLSSSPASSLDSGSHFASSTDLSTSFDAQLKASPFIHDILDRLARCEYATREVQRELSDVNRKVDLLVDRTVNANAPPEFKDPFAPASAPPQTLFSSSNGPRASMSAGIAPHQVAPFDDISQISNRLNTLTSSVGQLLALQTQQMQVSHSGLQNAPSLGGGIPPDLNPTSMMTPPLLTPGSSLGHSLANRLDMRTNQRIPNPPMRTWSASHLDIPLRTTESPPSVLSRQDSMFRDKRRSVSGLLRRESTIGESFSGSLGASSRENGPVITKWEQLALASDLLQSLNTFGVGPPNKIQQRALPFLLRGSDIIAQAPPTQERIAAYVIPAIHIALVNSAPRTPIRGPLVVMISTTVDQATQAQRMIRDIGGPIGIRSALGVGSTSGSSDLSQELRLLQQNMPHIICGTPQKLHALFTSPGGLLGSEVRFLVLDEVDQLIARNLHEYVFNIIKLLPPPRSHPTAPGTPAGTPGSSQPGFPGLDAGGSSSLATPLQNVARRFSAVNLRSSPPIDFSNGVSQTIERQTALFSNTVPQDVLNLASAIQLREPVRVLVRRDGNVTHADTSQGARGLRQFYLYLAFTAGGRSDAPLPSGGLGIIGSGRGASSAETAQAREWKLDALADLFDDLDVPHAIVHVGGMKALDSVVYKLASRGLEAVPLHGDMNAGAKLAALNKFRSPASGIMRQPTKVLIVYDVQVKTPEVSQIPLIINYDLPKAVEEYAHRVAPAIAPTYSRAGVIVNFVTATGGDVEMLRSIECFYK
ncbi:P-loop containing nucleoside triphosphate hydrolase protein [Laetiporus sulphureus 93-53]|uniref:RNA helicase n=1 Tax=Laetiporus sulphureus 93-53 TaxID=1314785 RepID=A0A165IDW3_9APHY|nr:P-loop containing nucleoside triphosphate hydrolase protein [Laetiporus sulphureus 93-53]KZT12942.1 P-loop containing nucleoside triphosphate hydrolase protein [Laetiporus sulphureus 93-53]